MADQPALKELQAEPPTRVYLEQMWAKRDFAAALPMEQLKTDHQATLLGNVWHLANPMLSVAVYYLIFGILLDTSRGIDNYILFLTVGMFSFSLTTNSFTGGARAISNNAGLMRSIRFPRAILPVSVILSKLMTFCFELCILAGLALLTGEGVSRRWLVLPIIVLLHSTFNLGGAFITARLNDSFRDVQQLIPFIMRLVMYASGVMFKVRERADLAPEWIGTVLRSNPLVDLVDLYRWVFMGTSVDMAGVFRLAVVAVIVLIVGFRFFIAAESKYGRA